MLVFELPYWLTGFNFLVALFSIVLMIGGAIVLLLVKGRGAVATVQIDRAVAAEALVKTREAERDGKQTRIEELEDELESVTAEHRTLVGIDIAKLMQFWAEKESIEVKMANLERDNRILKRRLGDVE
jgi:hypothetical protein